MFIEEFEEGKKYKFNTKQYIEAEGYNDYADNKNWVDDCENEVVEIVNESCGEIFDFSVFPEWCIEVTE